MNITIIEDCHGDYELIKKAIIESNIKIDYKFIHFDNGEKGLNFLFSKENDSHIIILDINLPDISGLDILTRIKKNERTKHIPTIIYSTSENKEDINQAYKSMANSYILKSFNSKDFYKIIKTFSEYWGKTVTLPQQ